MVIDSNELREQANRILDEISQTDDQQEQRQLAAKAFEIAQQAEAIDRLNQKSERDGNIRRLCEDLYRESSWNQRQIAAQLLIREERLYALNEERLDILNRLVADCAGRVSKLRASMKGRPANGNSLQESELLKNMLDTQQLLEGSLHNELARQNHNF